jgi:hypothetical protein
MAGFAAPITGWFYVPNDMLPGSASSALLTEIPLSDCATISIPRQAKL